MMVKLMPLFVCMVGPLAAAEHESAGGGSEFLTPLIPQAVWAAVVFLVVFLVLRWKAYPAIMVALDERARRIQDSLEAAEKAREAAEAERVRTSRELEAERRRLGEAMSKAQAELAQTRDQVLEAARAEAATLRRDAETAIERAKVNALGEIRKTAADLAVAAAESILKRRLSGDDDRRFAQETIDSVSKGS
jgi:F-type H+-transporting ATPase subunit b